MKKKKKGRVLLLISLIIGLMYACYAVSYFGGLITNSTSDSDVLASGVATALVMPHMVMVGIGIIFNALALIMHNRPFALVAAIMYTVALAVFPIYFMFVIVEMILCYIAFARMKKQTGDGNLEKPAVNENVSAPE